MRPSIVTSVTKSNDTERAEVLRLEVNDDGIGGANAALGSSKHGSGLAGLAERVSTVDGRIEVVSPAGGPTVVTVELPQELRGHQCGSLSPRVPLRRATRAAQGPRADHLRGRVRRRLAAGRGGRTPSGRRRGGHPEPPPTHTDEGLRAALQLRQKHPGTGVLMFSQYIETSYSAQLLEGGAAGVGHPLKDRVANVAEFSAALQRVADGGTALDPEVVSQLFRASRQRGGLATLTPRERQALALMAEGRSNAGIAAELVVSAAARSTWPASSTNAGLPPDESDTPWSRLCSVTWGESSPRRVIAALPGPAFACAAAG